PDTDWAEQVTYDDRNRIIETTGPDGLSSTYGWDALDRLISVTDTAGLRTTTHYDHASRPVTVYGAAPVASFNGAGLPVTPGTVPVTTKGYDEGIPGLAAAFWDNQHLAGGPVLHETGPDPATGDADQDWASSPPVTPGMGG